MRLERFIEDLYISEGTYALLDFLCTNEHYLDTLTFWLYTRLEMLACEREIEARAKCLVYGYLKKKKYSDIA